MPRGLIFPPSAPRLPFDYAPPRPRLDVCRVRCGRCLELHTCCSPVCVCVCVLWQKNGGGVVRTSSSRFIPPVSKTSHIPTLLLVHQVRSQRFALAFWAWQSGGCGIRRRRGGRRRRRGGALGLPVGRAVLESWGRERGWREKGRHRGGSGDWRVGRGE